MHTTDGEISASREYVCEQWGSGEAVVELYAPVTRQGRRTWVHPTWARQMTLEQAKRCADRIWQVTGSLWNPTAFRLVYQAS